MTRGLSNNFLAAMREKLEYGRRKGFIGWDQYWEKCSFPEDPTGPNGLFIRRLLEEVIELLLAIDSKDQNRIRLEAADVANFAMMIADIEGALE